MAGDISREFEYTEKPKQSSNWQLVRDIGETIILTLLMFLVIRLAVQDFQVDGTSMVPTLQTQQFVLVDKLTYFFGNPQRGDVIVFEYPLDHTQNYIKRIIGLPGDHVYISPAGVLSVNGTVLNEPYINDNDNQANGEISRTLGPNQYFVMGDNRGGSSDSRFWGPVDRSLIIGKASLIYWPFADLHFLPNEHTVFAQIANSAHSGVSTGNATPSNTDPLSDTIFIFLMPLAAAALHLKKIRWG